MRLQVRSKVRSLAAAGAVAFAVGCATAPPYSYQPHMQNALSALQYAQVELQQTPPDNGGHRDRALEIIASAISSVQLGIQWAAEHGG
ncbi:MAG: hypothetical protein ACLQDQ_01040 [Myxococcaceae bacterium]